MHAVNFLSIFNINYRIVCIKMASCDCESEERRLALFDLTKIEFHKGGWKEKAWRFFWTLFGKRMISLAGNPIERLNQAAKPRLVFVLPRASLNRWSGEKRARWSFEHRRSYVLLFGVRGEVYVASLIVLLLLLLLFF